MGALKWILPDGKNISGGLLDFTPFCVAHKTEKKLLLQSSSCHKETNIWGMAEWGKIYRHVKKFEISLTCSWCGVSAIIIWTN